jgi:ribosomal protein L11 methyltransferase
VIRLALRVRREHAEIALAELLALAPTGVEEVDLGDRVEYAVYGAPGELPALPDLEAAAGDALVEISTTEVPEDWEERWKRFHQPVDVGPLHVRPPWTPARDAGDIVIDPGQAFGTGAHHTTRLCLELMVELEPEGPFLDLGCGSGVLAIAAARLGWDPVTGLDHDSASVEATRENARVNGVELDVRRWDLRRDPLPGAPTIAANLVRPLVLLLAERMRQPPRTLVVSGLLAQEGDEAAAAFTRHGLRETARRTSGEWVALRLAREERPVPPPDTAECAG